MKYLIFIMLVSCANKPVRRPPNKTLSDKMRSCVFELIGRYGIKPKVATAACKEIYQVGVKK